MAKKEPELRSELMHIRVRPSTKDQVGQHALDEDRKLSDMGSILLEEAVQARKQTTIVRTARKAVRR